MTVRWIDGTEENCWPQAIELIPEASEYTYSLDDNDDDPNVSWETESIESIAGDLTDETTLQNMAARLDFVRNRIIYLKEAFKKHSIAENFAVRHMKSYEVFPQNKFRLTTKITIHFCFNCLLLQWNFPLINMPNT